jgi:hypothetical protein
VLARVIRGRTPVAWAPTRRHRWSDAIHERVMDEVILPTVRGMAAEGNRYTGFLYAGLMISPDGAPKVIEFNCRFGDPETQPIMLRLRSDLLALCQAAVGGALDRHAGGLGPAARHGRGAGRRRLSRQLPQRPADWRPCRCR